MLIMVQDMCMAMSLVTTMTYITTMMSTSLGKRARCKQSSLGPPGSWNFSPGTGADLSLELRQEHLWTRDSQDKTEIVDPDIYSIVMASYAVCSFVCQIGNSSTDLWETTDRTEICTLTLDV